MLRKHPKMEDIFRGQETVFFGLPANFQSRLGTFYRSKEANFFHLITIRGLGDFSRSRKYIIIEFELTVWSYPAQGEVRTRDLHIKARCANQWA
jgi:hypothetical protein